MKATISVNELNKILRTQLIKQSELDGEYVLNGNSMFGETLYKRLQEEEYNSYALNNCVLIFSLTTRDSTNDLSFTQNDDKIILYHSYSMNIRLYGNSCDNVANKLIGRFRSEKVKDDLLNEGIYVEQITTGTKLNEFVNDVLWERYDLSINITCKFEIVQTDKYENFEQLSSLDVINK